EREFRGFGRVDHRDSETLAGYGPALAPPTETRTWFYQGPVGDEFGAWSESDFSGEYWTGDAPVFSRPAPLTTWLNALPRRARRDALRAMRAKVLRSEVYVLD